MKKVFVVLLLLVSIFLIGNAEFAAAAACQDYQCRGTLTQDREFVETYDTCVELCYGNGFEVGIYGDCFAGYLYTINKISLLGIAGTCYGLAGCSVEGDRSTLITVKLSYIENDEGYVELLKCKPCDNCCK